MDKFTGLICGNSDIILQQMIGAGLKVDLVLTDPPYNINKDFGNDSDKLSLDDFLKVSGHRINLCKELLNTKGSLIWFGIHDYIGFIQGIMYQSGLYYRRMNIWFYENGFSRARTSPLTQYEPFLWFSKDKKKWTYNVDDIRIPYKSSERLKSPVYYYNAKGERIQWQPNPLGAMHGDVWRYPTLAGKLFKNEKTTHPTQKPESLITDIIKAFCPKDAEGKYCGIILDPFHGSGTLGACCEKLNKKGHHIKWIGIELEQRWCNIAQKRLDTILQEP